MSFSRLQQAIAFGSQFEIKDIQSALLFRPDSPESYATFRLALISKTIDPTVLFITAAVMSIEYDNIFLRHAALALRFGADPNTYIKAKFIFTDDERQLAGIPEKNVINFGEEDELVELPIHIAKHLWDLTPRNYEESVNKDFKLFGEYEPEESPPTNPATEEDYRILIPKSTWNFEAPRTQEEIDSRMREKQKTCMDLLCMMAIKGYNSDLTVSNTALLTQMNIDAAKFTINNPEFFASVYGDMILGDIEYQEEGNERESNPLERELGAHIANEVKYFEQWKNSLQSAYGINPEKDRKLLKYGFLLDITEVLTLSDVYGIRENLRAMIMFQDNNALEKIIPRLYQLKLISSDEDKKTTTMQKEFELFLFDNAIAYYNQRCIDFLLEIGVIPDYAIRSNTIRASKIVYANFPALAESLNKSIVDYVKEGYGLDNAQIEELSFSPETQQAIKVEYSTPAWIHMCKVRTGDVNPDIKEAARQIGLPLGSTKNQICDNLEKLSLGNPVTVKEASYKLNKERIRILSANAGDIVAGERILSQPRVLPESLNKNAPVKVVGGSNSVPVTYSPENNEVPDSITLRDEDGNVITTKASSSAGKNQYNPNIHLPKEAETVEKALCTNADSLTRPIEDYPDIDRIVYSDGKDTWCFVSDQFPDLLKRKANPWAKNPDGTYGAPIPDQVLSEMQQKMELIKREGLDPKAGSISTGIDEIFDSSPALTQEFYQKESNRRLEQFYLFMDDFGIDKDIWEELNPADYQLMIDNILLPQNIIQVSNSNTELALRDFADVIVTEITYFQDSGVVGNKIVDFLRTIPELNEPIEQ
jgi:hypothetical protein